MDTTTAAQQAGVTVDTIRVWARMGAVRATKRFGRWVIDATSLAYRIQLGKKAKPMSANAHTCGHEGTIRYRGRNKTRPVHPDLSRKCPTCRRADRELATQALHQTLAALRANLPTLTKGSPKQIAWADQIRASVFANPDRAGAEEYAFLGPLTLTGQPDGTVVYTHDDQLIELEQDIPVGEITADQAHTILRTMLTTTEATWWIDNR